MLIFILHLLAKVVAGLHVLHGYLGRTSAPLQHTVKVNLIQALLKKALHLISSHARAKQLRCIYVLNCHGELLVILYCESFFSIIFGLIDIHVAIQSIIAKVPYAHKQAMFSLITMKLPEIWNKVINKESAESCG